MQKSFPQNSSRKWNLFTLQMQLLNTSSGLCACTTSSAAMGRSTTPMHFPARGYPRTPPFEKLQRMQSFNGDINQRQWTASQFKQMPLRLTLSSLRRAEGRIANRLNSAALNSVFACQSLPASVLRADIRRLKKD